MYPLAHKGMGPVSTLISVGRLGKSRRYPAMVSTWQQDFRIFSGFPPRCLGYDQLSSIRHVHHSFCFLVVAPLARMSWDLKRRKCIGDEIRKEAMLQVDQGNYYMSKNAQMCYFWPFLVVPLKTYPQIRGPP